MLCHLCYIPQTWKNNTTIVLRRISAHLYLICEQYLKVWKIFLKISNAKAHVSFVYTFLLSLSLIQCVWKLSLNLTLVHIIDLFYTNTAFQNKNTRSSSWELFFTAFETFVYQPIVYALNNNLNGFITFPYV